MKSLGSFARFALGFLIFISLSVGITILTTDHLKGQETQSAASAQPVLVQGQ